MKLGCIVIILLLHAYTTGLEESNISDSSEESNSSTYELTYNEASDLVSSSVLDVLALLCYQNNRYIYSRLASY